MLISVIADFDSSEIAFPSALASVDMVYLTMTPPLIPAGGSESIGPVNVKSWLPELLATCMQSAKRVV